MQVKTDFFIQIVHNSSFLHISHRFVQQNRLKRDAVPVVVLCNEAYTGL